MPKIDQLLKIVKQASASDLHLAAGSVPMIRVDGELTKTRHKKLAGDNIRQLIYEVLTDDQIRKFEKTGDLDFSYSIDGLARFRMNICQTYSGIAASIRLIPDEVRDLAALGFSDVVRRMIESKSGMVLVTGPTNSGKSTTLSAMVDHINTHFARHIIALEDSIEHIHANKNSLISQRQIGLHSQSLSAALRAALREDPDVILIGEMRDTETIRLAIMAAELGLLVLGTLHTCTATTAIDRIVDVFPSDQQQQIRVVLADTLVGVISQQLVRRADGNGRMAAYELMVSTSSIRSLIREGRTYQIPSIIQTGRKKGMRLLDNHLKALVDSGAITAGEATKVATEPAEFYNRVTEAEPELTEA